MHDDFETLVKFIEFEFCNYRQTEYICERYVRASELEENIRKHIARIREIRRNRDDSI